MTWYTGMIGQTSHICLTMSEDWQDGLGFHIVSDLTYATGSLHSLGSSFQKLQWRMNNTTNITYTLRNDEQAEERNEERASPQDQRAQVRERADSDKRKTLNTTTNRKDTLQL